MCFENVVGCDVAGDVQVLYKMCDHICYNFKQIGISSTVATSVLKMFLEIPLNQNRSLQTCEFIFKYSLQTTIGQIERCPKTSSRAVLDINVIFASQAMEITNKIANLWQSLRKDANKLSTGSTHALNDIKHAKKNENRI